MIQKFGDHYFDPRLIVYMDLSKDGGTYSLVDGTTSDQRLHIILIASGVKIDLFIYDKDLIDKLLKQYQPKGE